MTRTLPLYETGNQKSTQDVYLQACLNMACEPKFLRRTYGEMANWSICPLPYEDAPLTFKSALAESGTLKNKMDSVCLQPTLNSSKNQSPPIRSKRPRGRPPCFSKWDGNQWVLDDDAVDKAAAKCIANRVRCRDRKRAERQALRELQPQLFTPLPKGQTTLS